MLIKTTTDGSKLTNSNIIDHIIMSFTLGKDKKLKSKKSIQQLFIDAQSIRSGALRCVYQPIYGQQSHKIGVSVSKRYFKKAPDRNRIKRMMREVYRLNQHEVVPNIGHHLEMMFIYQSPRMPQYVEVQRMMLKIIKSLNQLNNTQN